MAKVTKKEQAMLDSVRRALMMMRNHSTKQITSVHISRAQLEMFKKMKEKIDGDKSGVLDYAGVEFGGNQIKLDGIELIY